MNKLFAGRLLSVRVRERSGQLNGRNCFDGVSRKFHSVLATLHVRTPVRIAASRFFSLSDPFPNLCKCMHATQQSCRRYLMLNILSRINAAKKTSRITSAKLFTGTLIRKHTDASYVALTEHRIFNAGYLCG